jgi:hypothetical protein
VTVRNPAASDEVLKLAVPPLSVPVARRVVPILKDTVSPSGGEPKLELTVAVKVTVWPTSDGLREDVSVVLAVILVTVWVSEGDVLPRKFASPLYIAGIVFDPSGRVEMLKVAMPPVSVAVPKVVPPCLNVTEPVGVPNCPATLAVNVTVWHTTDGVTEDVSTVEVVALDTLCARAAEALPLKLLSPE